MKTTYLPAIIMLVAGLITCIKGFFEGYEGIFILTSTLISVVVFYLIGLIVQVVLKKITFIPEEEPILEMLEENQENEIE